MFLAVCYDSRSNYVLIHFCSFCSFCCILTVFYCIVWFCCFGVINNNNTTTAQGTEPRETHNFSNQFLLLLIVFYPGSDSLFFTPPVIALYTPWLRKKGADLSFFPTYVFPFLPRHYHMTRVLLSPFITTVWTPVILTIINLI